jgi:cytidylate kinase
MNIAIDGPAGAGKSTIAKRVAAKMGYIYVDTGAMYRAMALYFLQKGIPSSDEAAIADAVRHVSVEIRYEEGQQQVILNGDNVTGRIRDEQVGNMASATSVYGCVRQKLVALQQEMAQQQDVVMDGRDIGTCVLPNAQVKIYLTASVETRAKRRFLELQDKQEACDLEEIKADIASRDQRDMQREISPLRQAEDAILIDSSHMSIEEVTEEILDLIRSNSNP